MKKKGHYLILFMMLLVGCGGNEQVKDEESQPDVSQEVEEATEIESSRNDGRDESVPEKQTYEDIAEIAIQALKEKDFTSLAGVTHPSNGLLFSPYGYIDVETANVFSVEEIPSLLSNTTIYEWGTYDGIGGAIELTFNDYYDQFVYDEDFVNAPERSVDERIGQGNTLDNISEIFPDSKVIEYHFPEIDPQYNGMDWRSLRLVLVEEDDVWYVVAIVHDEWTI